MHNFVHKTQYMILRSMNTELPCSQSNINHHTYHTRYRGRHLKNSKFSLLLHYVASKDVAIRCQVSYPPNTLTTGLKIQKPRVNWRSHIFAHGQV